MADVSSSDEELFVNVAGAIDDPDDPVEEFRPAPSKPPAAASSRRPDVSRPMKPPVAEEKMIAAPTTGVAAVEKQPPSLPLDWTVLKRSAAVSVIDTGRFACTVECCRASDHTDA